MPTLCISRGRERAHIHVHEKEEHVRAELAAAHTKKPAEQPSCNGKNRWRHRRIYPYLGCIFSKGGEKTEKNSFLTPPKNPWSSGSVSREQSFLCQPENRNFPGTANFMSSKGQEFPGYDHFHANRKTKKNKSDNLFLRPAEKSQPEFLSRKAGNPKISPKKLETELHIHNLNRDFSMQHNLNQPDNLKPQAHSFPRLPIVFMFFYRETYVFPVGNLRFTAGKRTAPLPETWKT